jgi:uncharacterized protein (TIGR03083 family)
MISDVSATTMPAPTPQQAAAQGEQEYTALLAMLRSLSADDWTKPTECPGWTVREMVAHITGAAEEAVRPSVQLRHLAVARTRGRRLPTADSLSAQQIAGREGRATTEILAELERLAAQAPHRRQKVPGPVRRRRLQADVEAPQREDTVAYLLDVTYNRDLWMHRLDIDRATGCGMTASGAEAAIVAQVVRDLSRAWEGAPFVLTLTGRVEGSWGIGDGSREGGSVVVDAVALCRLLSGRRDEVRPVHAGPDAGLLERLRAVRVLF